MVNFNFSSRTNNQRGAPPSTPQRPSILGKRKSFVGTPCWMAPEVINGKQYDASADIWSFGITAIELAQGRAPRSRLDPHQTLVKTVTDAPPHLERNSGPHRYSSAFAETVAMCLNKDPSKRPTASDLLQMHFFRNARKPSYLCSTILKDLPPLTQRQERRKQPSILTHPTMDSWDFTPSIPASPTTSVYSHNRRPLSLVPPDSMFEMDDSQRNVDLMGPDGRESTHRDVDGRSDAAAYAVQIRAQNRGSLGHNWHSRSRSVSYHSHHSHHSNRHSRHQSHNESRSTIHSIQEVMVQEVPSGESSDSDSVREQEQREFLEQETTGMPAAVPPPNATLDVPSRIPAPSTSPSLSCKSSASATSSSSSPMSPCAPLTSSSFMGSAKLQSGKLWRKLAGKPDPQSDKAKSELVTQPPTTTSARKRSFGAVLGRTAHMSADLVRTASRTISYSKQTR